LPHVGKEESYTCENKYTEHFTHKIENIEELF
jgi:hypothetical protein